MFSPSSIASVPKCNLLSITSHSVLKQSRNTAPDSLDDRCLDEVFQTGGIPFALVKEVGQGGAVAGAMGGKIHGFPVVPKGECGN